MSTSTYGWLYPKATSHKEAHHLYLAEKHRCRRLARTALKLDKVSKGIETPEATFLDLYVPDELRQRGLPSHLELVLFCRSHGHELLDAADAIHQSSSWRQLRDAFMAASDKRCCKCGRCEDLQVDHIQPVSLYPDKALSWDNLQVLCGACNREKSNRNSLDYRYGEPRPKVNRQKSRLGLKPSTVANRFRTLMLMLGIKPPKGLKQRHAKILAEMPQSDMVKVFEILKSLIEEQRASISRGTDSHLHEYLRKTIDWEIAPYEAIKYANRTKG